MLSTSESLRPGIIGDASTPTGTPASTRERIARRRRSGVGARGSIRRASSLSSVVTDTMTWTRFCEASACSRSKSRKTRLDFRDDAHRVPKLFHHFQNRTSDLKLFLHRLIRIGIRAEGDHLRSVTALRELLSQSRRCLRFGKDAAFEIESRRKADKGMSGSGKTIDAAVLATLIRVDRQLEWHIWRVRSG